METITIRGAELAYRQSGTGAAELVLVHGFQNDHTGWQAFIDRLDLERYRVTTFDLVGTGASGPGGTWSRCTIDEYADDLVALADHLDLQAPVVVGHSLGGATAIRAALQQPGRLSGLVLVAPASTLGLDFVPDDEAFEVLAHPTPEQQAALARAAFRAPLPDADMAALLDVVARATPEHIEGAARSMRDFVVVDRLGELSLPVLLVCGDRDRHVPLRNHLATQQAIPRCGLQVYFDVGHVPQAEVADRFTADVVRFLATVGAG